ncbi:hypothetical protein [Paraburkholderia sp. MM5477-R1]|uniref:hypothetical protein n=1 Tax=Paraburkholderia sp. MM5477-R1 TaxID=2991062 RepID=UPI003D20FA79
MLAILEEMHDGRHVRQWLECDCWPGATTQPRLTARVREEGPRHFVRMHGYGEHRCALASFRQQPEPEDEPDDAAVPPGRHNPLKPVGDALDYLDDEHEGAARPGGSGGSASGTGETGRRLPRLGRIMHTLLDDAGFATVHVDVLKEKTNSWERLKPYADAEAMSPELTLGQVLFTEPWTSINEKMAAIDALPWPEKKARSALLLFVADEIRDGAAIKRTRLGERIVRPEKGIRAGGRDQRLTQPPYWVLAVVDRDREGSARYREAFAQHAYSFRQPVPLDSRYERLTLECLFRVMEWVRTRGVEVTLGKPLFDREVRQPGGPSLWCRPDFELTFRTAASAGAAELPVRCGAFLETRVSSKNATLSIIRVSDMLPVSGTFAAGGETPIRIGVVRITDHMSDVDCSFLTVAGYFRLPERNCLSRSLRGLLSTSSGSPSSSVRP